MDEETMVAIDELEAHDADEDEAYLGDASTYTTCSQQQGCS